MALVKRSEFDVPLGVPDPLPLGLNELVPFGEEKRVGAGPEILVVTIESVAHEAPFEVGRVKLALDSPESRGGGGGGEFGEGVGVREG